MDIDAFVAVRQDQWRRLDTLASRRRLTGAEADELAWLYRAASTDLSTVRSGVADPALVATLSSTVQRGRTALTGASDPSLQAVATFMMVSLPVALYRLRWWTAAVAAAFLLISVATGVWMATTPGALDLFGPAEAREEYVRHAFAAYYDPGVSFAAMVWTNNAWIAAQAIAFGVTGIWPVYVIAGNAVNVGLAGGVMAAYGELGLFLQLIAPHGLLELTSIFIAGAAGLKLFWTVVSPGRRTRTQAIAQEGRAMFTLIIGLALTLALSGLVEGFVTGSALPWAVKIAIGAAALGAVIVYAGVLGRRAAKDGATGDLEEFEAGYAVAVS